MEYLDIYTEEGNYIGKELRKTVHENALWHKTVHCWLYDSKGNVYFQIRKDEKKLYTTASGHVSAGESVNEAFDREINEEIGIDTSNLIKEQIEIVFFRMNRENKDGSIFKDRAFANIFICRFDEPIEKFKFDLNEIDGLVKVNAKEAFDLLRLENGKIKGTIIEMKDDVVVERPKEIIFEDFLVNNGETGIGKYGDILEKIMFK